MPAAAGGKRVHRRQKSSNRLRFSWNYRLEVTADGPNITPTISERKRRKSGGGRRPERAGTSNSSAVLQIANTDVHQDIVQTYEPK
jgi:hypothetical protein